MGGSVIVIGGGLAGLSASISAVRAGAKVTLLEKSKGVGGNSAKATSGINGAVTQYQMDASITDSIEDFTKDTISSGGGLSNPKMVDILVNSSKDAVEFLSSFGLNLSAISQCGGHSKPRTHREPPMADGKPAPVGWDIIKTLSGHTAQLAPDAFSLITNARATRFLLDHKGDKVVGVEYLEGDQTKELKADAVVLTTGGFCCDRREDSLLKQYAPQKAHLATTNGPFADGDGIRMALPLNVKLIHMDKVQVHPTGFVDPQDPLNPVKFLGPEALRGCGGILLNSKGERFVDELGRRDHVSQEIFSQSRQGMTSNPPATATILMNHLAVERFGSAAWAFYSKVKKFGAVCEGVTALAEHLKVPEETLKKVFADYQAAASGEKPDPYGKKVFPVVFKETDTFHVCTITPSLHYSMGGLKINEKCVVIRGKEGGGEEEEEEMKGLFAAGEVTGGVHGENRLAGNSLLECVVFGRIAGISAAAFAAASSSSS